MSQHDRSRRIALLVMTTAILAAGSCQSQTKPTVHHHKLHSAQAGVPGARTVAVRSGMFDVRASVLDG